MLFLVNSGAKGIVLRAKPARTAMTDSLNVPSSEDSHSRSGVLYNLLSYPGHRHDLRRV